MTRYLHHVTLNTGHTRRSPRSEVGEDIPGLLWPLLRAALRNEHTAIPGQPGYTMTGGVHGQCCIVTVWAPDVAAPQQRVPFLSFAVAGHSRCGARTWRALHGNAVYVAVATDPDHAPPEPWCADLLHLAALTDLDAVAWTADFARCIAWTWLEERPTTKTQET